MRRNGAGKSTLLRLIAGVLIPDEGDVTVWTGVAPLIALTGGYNAELAGRDNIRLIAGLHGMSEPEIDAAFDEIVDFSGIGGSTRHRVRALFIGHEGAARLFGRVPACANRSCSWTRCWQWVTRRFAPSARSASPSCSRAARPCSWCRTMKLRSQVLRERPLPGRIRSELRFDGPIDCVGCVRARSRDL